MGFRIDDIERRMRINGATMIGTLIVHVSGVYEIASIDLNTYEIRLRYYEGAGGEFTLSNGPQRISSVNPRKLMRRMSWEFR